MDDFGAFFVGVRHRIGCGHIRSVAKFLFSNNLKTGFAYPAQTCANAVLGSGLWGQVLGVV